MVTFWRVHCQAKCLLREKFIVWNSENVWKQKSHRDSKQFLGVSNIYSGKMFGTPVFILWYMEKVWYQPCPSWRCVQSQVWYASRCAINSSPDPNVWNHSCLMFAMLICVLCWDSQLKCVESPMLNVCYFNRCVMECQPDSNVWNHSCLMFAMYICVLWNDKCVKPPMPNVCYINRCVMEWQSNSNVWNHPCLMFVILIGVLWSDSPTQMCETTHAYCLLCLYVCYGMTACLKCV